MTFFPCLLFLLIFSLFVLHLFYWFNSFADSSSTTVHSAPSPQFVWFEPALAALSLDSAPFLKLLDLHFSKSDLLISGRSTLRRAT
jgi:hypothetical protein